MSWSHTPATTVGPRASRSESRETLQEAGLDAAARPVADVNGLEDCEALVIGSGVYLGRWPKEAREFVDLNQGLLRDRPVWIFSSGPVGAKAAHADPRELADDALRASEKVELEETLRPRDHIVFSGGFSRKGLRFCDRMVAIMPAARAALPEGDFRNWEAIRDWAVSIAAALVADERRDKVGVDETSRW